MQVWCGNAARRFTPVAREPVAGFVQRRRLQRLPLYNTNETVTVIRTGIGRRSTRRRPELAGTHVTPWTLTIKAALRARCEIRAEG
jgi:hypothetical protein